MTYGETQVLATCTPRSLAGDRFLPAPIDVEEPMYAAGKIPGGVFRREGRRRDRDPHGSAHRPADASSFEDGYRDEVQVVIAVLSADMANPLRTPG